MKIGCVTYLIKSMFQSLACAKYLNVSYFHYHLHIIPMLMYAKDYN